MISLCAAVSCRDEKPDAAIATTPGAGERSAYTCRQVTPVDAASVWPIPGDAEVTPSGVHTKRLRKGNGRTPGVGSGQVLILCLTYYDRSGAVVQHDPVVVHDIDLPAKEWQEVLSRMSEGEIPFPLPEDPRRKPPQ